MRPKILFNNIGFCVLVIALVSAADARDAGPVNPEGPYENIIDRALDRQEGSRENPGDETVIEIPVDVEVLESIAIDETVDITTEEPLETKIIPLLHAEAATIMETLEAMKGPKGEILFNDSAVIAVIDGTRALICMIPVPSLMRSVRAAR